MDRAVSDDPAVQRQLDRLASLSPGVDTLGLERISALCARLGNPERALPPVFHVAGTNGKGSTCAFLRAALEASGRTVHAFTSPHLVRFNERIRVAGTLIEDVALSALLAEVLDASDDIEPSFFEVTTAVAFLAFARTPADADALVEADEVRAGEGVNRMPARLERGAQECARRSLAVRACNVEDCGEPILRAAEPVEKACDAIEPETVSARRQQRQPFQLSLDGRMLRPREVRHQAAFFFSGVR